jgi:hypothetical protein
MGNFDSTHLYVQWGGKLPGGEQWSCGFRMRKKTAGAVDSGAGLLVGIGAALSAYHTRADTLIGAAAKLSFVKVNAIGVDGHYVADGTNQAIFGDLAGGVGGGTAYPNQVCCVVTLTTGFSRGPAHKGRFYLPLPAGMGVSTDGRCLAAVAQSVSDSTDTMIAAVNGVNADYEVAVFSRKTGAAGNRRVTGNVVGRVLDTQRRRRRQLAEDWQ